MICFVDGTITLHVYNCKHCSKNNSFTYSIVDVCSLLKIKRLGVQNIKV